MHISVTMITILVVISADINVIGLLNHREFVIMVGGLLVIGVLGIMVDIWLAILIAEKGFFASFGMIFHCSPGD